MYTVYGICLINNQKFGELQPLTVSSPEKKPSAHQAQNTRMSAAAAVDAGGEVLQEYKYLSIPCALIIWTKMQNFAQKQVNINIM